MRCLLSFAFGSWAILAGCSSNSAPIDASMSLTVDALPAIDAAPAIRFSTDVVPILSMRCSNLAQCHAASQPAQGLDLTGSVAYDNLVNVPSTECGGRLLVAPGDPSSSYLIDKLRGTNLCSGVQMPQGSPLSDAQIQTISAWISAGANND